MILDAIISAAMTVVSGVLGLFPTFGLDDPRMDGSLSGQLAAIGRFGNAWFPLTTIGMCLGVIAGAWVFVFVVRAVILAYDLIPFKAS